MGENLFVRQLINMNISQLFGLKTHYTLKYYRGFKELLFIMWILSMGIYSITVLEIKSEKL